MHEKPHEVCKPNEVCLIAAAILKLSETLLRLRRSIVSCNGVELMPFRTGQRICE